MKIATPQRRGFSLVLSLIILTLLAILIVGFISSTDLDRRTARAFSNKAQAQIAAETAVSAAISLVRENIAQYPDSATTWEKLNTKAGEFGSEGTVLYFRDRLPPTGLPNSTGPTSNTPAKHFLLPLFTLGVGANGVPLGAVEVGKKSEALGSQAWTADNTIDVNRPRDAGDQQGWVGKAPGMDRPKLRAKWMPIKEQTKPEANARLIGRYAFWIEDETFKVNANLLGMKPRESETNSPGTSPAEMPLQGLLRSARADIKDRDAFAARLSELRNGFVGKRLLDLRSFNQLDATYRVGDETKFLATIFSGGLNLSRHGSQRLNLNGLGIENANASVEDVQKQVGRIVETINYHAPRFGQRFYRLATNTASATMNAESVSLDHQRIYRHKIAANIRDYIDPDFQPTMILNTGKVAPRVAPTFAMNGNVEGDPNEVWAQGKDTAPFMDEAVVRYRTEVTGLRYSLRVDYYVEFWNMTDQDITAADLGYPFLRVVYEIPWRGSPGGEMLTADNSPPGNPDDSASRAMVIDLFNNVLNEGAAQPRGVVFRKNTFTVITTDPDYRAVPTSWGTMNKRNVYLCSCNKREFKGPLPSGATGIQPLFRSTRSSDYEVEMILGNSRGYLEWNTAPLSHSTGSTNPPTPTTTGSPQDNRYGGTLLGNNTTVSQLSDPRTNNEQLKFTRYRAGTTGEPDQARYFNSSTFSLGYPNDAYTNPHAPNIWPDYYRGWDKKSEAAIDERTPPAFVANKTLDSIGQLGDVFDPARLKGGVGSLGVEGARGGGRTFRIGQPDDRVDFTKADALSREWASWRLADFLDTSSDVQLPGLINLNGIRRDNGAALRAAVYAMTIRSTSRPRSGATTTAQVSEKFALDSEENANSPLASATGVQAIILQAIARMTQGDATVKGSDPSKPFLGPFMERGEVSELPLFNSGTNLLKTVSMTDAFDRTREEFVRRMLDLTTTRGSVFTVYAVGQSISEGPPPKRQVTVTGTHQTKVTFALVPKKVDGSDFHIRNESFDYADASAVEERFAKPDHYDIQILQVGP